MSKRGIREHRWRRPLLTGAVLALRVAPRLTLAVSGASVIATAAGRLGVEYWSLRELRESSAARRAASDGSLVPRHAPVVRQTPMVTTARGAR